MNVTSFFDVDNPYVRWGTGSYISANVGHWIGVLLCEFLVYVVKVPLLDQGKESRRDSIAKTQLVLSYGRQFREAAWNMLGPTAVINSLLLSYILQYFVQERSTYSLTVNEFGLHFILLQLIGDLGLYWGHRIQHEVEFLWVHCHSYHHQIRTPTAISTVCIDQIDATLQAGIPMLVAIALVRPHHLTMYAYIAARLFENVVNHSGINSVLFDIITLKVLPFRASIKHHDDHHRYSNYARNAKNYGENFVIWDRMFGTSRKTTQD